MISEDVRSQRYEIGRLIAKGGMATVFEGKHQLTGRRVALKVIARDQKPNMEERLRREARILGELRHPNIVDVLDMEETVRHVLLVLELVDGRPLDGLLASRGKLSPEHTLGVLAELASALAHVHDRGFVHRDVKPANVVIMNDGGSDRVRLLDFGVAGLLKQRTEAKLTSHGAFVGTLAYTPPEQLQRSDVADPRSDQYALGMLAFEASVGELHPLPDRMRAAPQARALRDKSGLPESAAKLICRMLEPNPDQRFATMAEVAAELPRPARLTVLDEPKTTQANSDRKHVRAPFLTPIRLLHDGHHFDGRSENISRHGLMVIIPPGEPSPKNRDLVQVRFALPVSGKQVEVRAEVRWARESIERRALGLELTELPAELPDEVAAYLRFFAP